MQLLVFLAGLFFTPTAHTVNVTVSSSSPETGLIRLAVYASAEDFAQQREIISAVKPSTGPLVELELALPAAGTYALAAFHDLNNNGKLDRNFFGIPTEPYGFGRTPQSKWTEPAFADVATTFTGKKAAAKLELKLWKEY